MSHPKVERARELVSAIDRTRNELSALEKEFEELIMPKSRQHRSNGTAKPTKTNRTEPKKPSRNKVKILRMLKRSNKPMGPQEIQKKLGISDASTSANLKALIDSGEVIRPSYGQYKLKS